MERGSVYRWCGCRDEWTRRLLGARCPGLRAAGHGSWDFSADLWTPALTERWTQEGWRSVVGVWTAAQTAGFLRQVRGHRLYALFHLVALRGLRRGEAAGLRWSDLDLDAGTLAVSEQLQRRTGS